MAISKFGVLGVALLSMGAVTASPMAGEPQGPPHYQSGPPTKPTESYSWEESWYPEPTESYSKEESWYPEPTESYSSEESWYPEPTESYSSEESWYPEPTYPPYHSEGWTSSTIYATKVYTITACPESVTYCPYGETTSTEWEYTTYCPESYSYTFESTATPGDYPVQVYPTEAPYVCDYECDTSSYSYVAEPTQYYTAEASASATYAAESTEYYTAEASSYPTEVVVAPCPDCEESSATYAAETSSYPTEIPVECVDCEASASSTGSGVLPAMPSYVQASTGSMTVVKAGGLLLACALGAVFLL